MLTCYCKKCDREVPVGDNCPTCGAKLSPGKAHAVWTVERLPVADWLHWNAPMRVALPVIGLALLISTVVELVSGGWPAVERLYQQGLGRVALALLLAVALITLLALLLGGRELCDCTVDSRGVHLAIWLPEPNALKLICRGRPPRLAAQGKPESPLHEVLVEERHLSWAEVSRVQLWPEKGLILFYKPRHWLRLGLPCTVGAWEDALGFIREKLGRRKQVVLPPSLRPEVEKKKPKAGKKPAGTKNHVNGPRRIKPPSAQGVSLTDIRAMNEELNRQDRRENGKEA